MKVLILSHNSITSDTNMGLTAQRILRNFKKEELCQLNIYNNSQNVLDTPQTLVLEEKQMIKSILTRKSYWHETENLDNTDYKSTSRTQSTSVILLIRHFLWFFSKWKTKELVEWLTQQSPDIILVMPGDSTFIYYWAHKLSKLLQINLVAYFGDDYTKTAIGDKTVIDKIYNGLILSMIKKLVSYSKGNIFISSSMMKNFEERFSVSGINVVTPYDNIISTSKEPNKPYKIIYAGNLGLGRLESIIDIIKVIEKNNELKKNYIIEIYGPHKNEKKINLLNTEFSSYKGILSPELINEKIKESDILLHVESFEKGIVKSIAHSFSTKLANYIASSRYIVAYGPKNIFSIDYIDNYKLGYVANSIRDIENIFVDIINNGFNNELLKNTQRIADLNHSPFNISKNVYEYIKECI